MNTQSENNLIWIDLEMTGLDTVSDHIIEIATVITDSQLNIIKEGPVSVIHVPDQVLTQMDKWNTKQHNKSGLVKRVQASHYTCRDAERLTLQFIQEFVPASVSPMCGNSICQDRRFLARQMPELEAYFHYRHIDVSTVKELYKRWQGSNMPSFSKTSEHLALSDIYKSIEELNHYRKYFFVTD